MNKKIYVDIDNTICFTNGGDYKNVIPNFDNINKVNKLYDDNNVIIMWTARGTVTGINWFDITLQQLINWKVKFHELRMGKPDFDILIDDKTLNSVFHWSTNNVKKILDHKFDKSNNKIILCSHEENKFFDIKINNNNKIYFNENIYFILENDMIYIFSCSEDINEIQSLINNYSDKKKYVLYSSNQPKLNLYKKYVNELYNVNIGFVFYDIYYGIAMATIGADIIYFYNYNNQIKENCNILNNLFSQNKV